MLFCRARRFLLYQVFSVRVPYCTHATHHNTIDSVFTINYARFRNRVRVMTSRSENSRTNCRILFFFSSPPSTHVCKPIAYGLRSATFAVELRTYVVCGVHVYHPPVIFTYANWDYELIICARTKRAGVYDRHGEPTFFRSNSV